MSNANPLVPQGSLMDQQARSKPHLRIAICIVVIHLVFLGGLLMQGCKKEPGVDLAKATPTNEYQLPLGDTNNLFPATNPDLQGQTNLGGYGQPAVGGYPPPGGLTSALPHAATPTPVYTPIEVESPAPPATQDYTVARGDSFFSIGKKFGVSATAIAKANPGVDSRKLQIGQKLSIPSATSGGVTESGTPAGDVQTYTVQKGDTLYRIAKDHGTTVKAIQDLNGLRTTGIQVGQKLKLPAKAVSPATPAPTPGTLTPAGSGAPIPQ